jgi:hypothetical protein
MTGVSHWHPACRNTILVLCVLELFARGIYVCNCYVFLVVAYFINICLSYLLKPVLARNQWLTPIILATQEAVMSRIAVQSQPREIVHKILA